MHFNIRQQSVSQPINNNSQRPVVLTIAGSDSAGCAGLAMDIKTQHALGVHTAVVVTANTAQTNQGVASINTVPFDAFTSQLDSVRAQNIRAIKIGLINAIEQIDYLAQFLSQVEYSDIPVVLDPVIQSSSGKVFFDRDTLMHYQKILIPLCTVITPNLHELKSLTQHEIHSLNDIEFATKQLMVQGADAVLVKGGHANDFSLSDDWVQDYFTTGHESFWLGSKAVEAKASRGTGCALASGIAASLALGYSQYDAIVIAKMAINQGLRQGYCLSDSTQINYGPVDITHFPMEQTDLPLLSVKPLGDEHFKFPSCGEKPLGLYPVVDRADWLERLAPAGVTTIQLRIKDLTGDALLQEIKRAVAIAKQFDMRLFINDYWQLAIDCGAYGVHLGQEDIDTADLRAIQNAGLRLGLSTHCHYEVARAHRYQPSYIACGPVFRTQTKDMPWSPHGLDGLRYWRQVLDYPLVAIGGINRERFDMVATIGVDSIAMITAITLAEDPTHTAAELVTRLAEMSS